MNKQIEVDFFDRFGESYGNYDVFGDLAYQRLCQTFALRIRPLANEICLDLGCGAGAFTSKLRQFNLKLHGLDISPKLIEIAAAKADSICFQEGDIMATNWPDESCDIITYSAVLHHFPESETRQKVLREGFRMLKKGGRLFAYDPNLLSPSMWLYRHPASPFYSSQGKTDNEVLFDAKKIKAELVSAGFAEVQVDALSGTTFRFVEGSLARRFLPVYNLYEKLMMMTPLEKTFGTFLISTAQK